MNQQASLFDSLGYPAGSAQAMTIKTAATESRRGVAMKAAGQEKAERKAGAGWQAVMITALRAFCANKKLDGMHSVSIPRFTMDEFRLYAKANYLPDPESMNAWGALPRRAVREGVIRATGEFRQAVIESAHARVVRVWEVV